MPTFKSGESKTARVTMRNPTAKAFDYTGFIYMGTDLAVVSEVPFSLNAGEEKQVPFPVTMPAAPGTYPVHIGVFSGGKNLALYRAIEDVVIVPAGVYPGNDFLSLISVGGKTFSRVETVEGRNYAYVDSPIVLDNLGSSLLVEYLNKAILEPGRLQVQLNYMPAFSPPFGYGGPGFVAWTAPIPPVGQKAVAVPGLYAGGYWYPGLYDVYVGFQFFVPYQVGPRWTFGVFIKNLVQCTGLNPGPEPD